MNKQGDSSRRHFLKSTAAVIGGSVAAQLSVPPNAHAAGSDVLRVGLIGCGSRGTGAAAQALRADKNVRLVALGDAFSDRWQDSLATLRKDEAIADKIAVKNDHCFTGFDAYKEVLAAGVDVVLLCTPPGIRPLHLKAAVEAGKHVFAEKPVAVDAPGVRSVLESAALARRKKLVILSGLCLRFDYGHRETIKRIHNGAVGDVVALQANDLRGPIWVKRRQKGWTDMEWQMRNWYYFTWLSGDFNVEQHVHLLDLCSWLMRGEYPVRANGLGGRQVRTGPEYGHIFDHHSVVYEFANGARLHAHCRQQKDCHKDITVYVQGSKGRAVVSEHELSMTTDTRWRYRGRKNNCYQTEHDVLFASIRAGKPINNGDYMSYSTLMAIMGRMATYTGQTITWEQALKSKEDLTPPSYDWEIKLCTPPVAEPGRTRFV
jgi:predicted dehydrogenase